MSVQRSRITRAFNLLEFDYTHSQKKDKKFWEELIAYFPLIRHGPRRNDASNNYFTVACIRCRGNVFFELYTRNDRGNTQTDGRDL
jgi:hypothetical protein